MAEIVVRPAASADIAGLYAFGVQQFGMDTADDYHAGLEAAIARLAEFPESGPLYPGLRPPIRFLTYRRHHIFYDYDGANVWIVRVLHHAMYVSTRLGG
jgi:toxin ParE1/3/4